VETTYTIAGYLERDLDTATETHLVLSGSSLAMTATHTQIKDRQGLNQPVVDLANVIRLIYSLFMFI
jgi:hypothetical protein